jgi:hypothetical protein
MSVAAFLFSVSIPGIADDSAASIAAGGLVPRRETRIVMSKEVLRISEKKVVVDYDFRNDTDRDVTTEVAFPIPPYKNDFPNEDIPGQSFQSFRLWVEGKPVHCEVEAKATLNGKDVTNLLEANHIDVATFGHFVDTVDATNTGVTFTRDFDKLPKPVREKLVKDGLFNEVESPVFSTWAVHLQYHWTQAFPAHSTIHIRHEYAPAVGYQLIQHETFKSVLAAGKNLKANPLTPDRPQDDKDLLASFCPDPSFLLPMIQSLSNADPSTGGYTETQWVDFILTTANTWQRPIEDFTLIIERPAVDRGSRTLVSLCSPEDGKVEKLDADHFQVHLTNFVPKSELHIGFFDVP